MLNESETGSQHFLRSAKGRPLTGSTGGVGVQFLSAPVGGQTETQRGAGLQEGGCGSLILKWFRSQVEQVKWLRGRRKSEDEEGENRSFLKANGLSMDILYHAEYYKICWVSCPPRAISHCPRLHYCLFAFCNKNVNAVKYKKKLLPTLAVFIAPAKKQPFYFK